MFYFEITNFFTLLHLYAKASRALKRYNIIEIYRQNNFFVHGYTYLINFNRKIVFFKFVYNKKAFNFISRLSFFE